MFLDRPLFGCGYGQYVDESRYYLHDRSTDLVLEKARPFCQHNVFLSLLTETGLTGMGLFVVLLFLWTRDAWRLWQCRAAPWWIREQGLLMMVLLGNYLPNGMFHDVSLIPMVNMVLFFMAGLTRGLAARISTDQASNELSLANADIGSVSPEESPPPTVGAF
jgi:O-antigen ligase